MVTSFDNIKACKIKAMIMSSRVLCYCYNTITIAENFKKILTDNSNTTGEWPTTANILNSAAVQ